MHYERPIVMSIAGFDPSGGAGLLADIKTLEQHQCLGLGVATAWTIQTENRFLKVDWLSLENIKAQAAPLLDEYMIPVVKIGIVESLELLLHLVLWLRGKNESVKIVWDTILSASTGFLFMNASDNELLKTILKNVFLITPNILEVRQLSDLESARKAAEYLSGYTNVLLKGGHAEAALGIDILLTEGKETALMPSGKKLSPKHGSGCILSAAIAANLAKGLLLEEACRKAKEYIEIILGSNQNLLAYHHV